MTANPHAMAFYGTWDSWHPPRRYPDLPGSPNAEADGVILSGAPPEGRGYAG